MTLPEHWHLAKKRLLAEASVTTVRSSATVLSRAERKTRPHIRGDTIRWAYWELVGDGWLVRTTRGVRKVTKNPVSID